MTYHLLPKTEHILAMSDSDLEAVFDRLVSKRDSIKSDSKAARELFILITKTIININEELQLRYAMAILDKSYT